LLGIAILTLAVSYISIGQHVGTFFPWHEIVHEGGQLTLVWTILYFDHAARELPLDIVLGLAIGASVFFAFPPDGNDSTVGVHARRGMWLAGLVTLLSISTIIAGTLWKSGAGALANNLLQMHTRPGAELLWGAHWRYHLLSRSALMLSSLGLAGLMVLFSQGRTGQGDRTGLQVFGWVLVLFVLISLVFAPDLDPLRDPVFLGHQIREVFTHGLVTLPFAWGVCLLLARVERLGSTADRRVGTGWTWLAGLAGIVLGLYLLVGALSTSAASHGQTRNLSMLIFPHFFEHSFTYVVVSGSTVFVFQWLTLQRLKMRPRP
jgi:hypothetical protein